jgi:hypothetical protein
MSEEVPQVPEGRQHLFGHKEFLQLFDEMSFREKWKRVLHGLRQPKESGEYKYAKLQMIRLSAPASAVVVPAVLILVVALLAAVSPPEWTAVKTRIIEPEKTPELDKVEPVKEDAPEPPEPMDENVDMTVSDVVTPGPPEPFSPQPAQFDTVALVKSPVIMRGIYGSRSPGSRGSALAKYGGGSGTEGAVLRALRWLKREQNSDGSWNACRPAMTGFALLTYLAHGETPASEEFGATVEKAIRFLVDSQEPGGRFKGRDGHDYTHPIATYALCEAYGLTKVPMLKDAAAKALDVVIAGQHPNGGFNYNLNNNDPNRNDSTYMSWCCQALKAGKMAGLENAGLDEAMKRSIDGWKVNMRGDATGATIGYAGPGNSGLTGAATLCLQLMGAGNDPLARGGMIALQKTTYNWEGGGTYNCLYYWYYITQAMFHTGGEIWNTWNKLFSPVLVKNQTIISKGIALPNGQMADIGYWEPPKGVSGHTDSEGKVMNTCLCTLQLEVYYRYLPTFKHAEATDVGASTEAAAKPGEDVDINVQNI